MKQLSIRQSASGKNNEKDEEMTKIRKEPRRIYWQFDNSNQSVSIYNRAGKNPGFFKKTQPTWVFLGFLGFFGFFSDL